MYLLLDLIIAIIGTIYFCFVLKGNSTRSHIEISGHMSNFDMYSFVDKLLWGIIFSIKGIENEYIIVIFIICCLTFYQSMTSNRWLHKFIDSILFIYFGLNLLYQIGIANTCNTSALHMDILFRMIEIDDALLGVSMKLILLTFIHIDMYVMLGCMLIQNKSDKREGLLFITYFGALGTSVIMGGSPTIYASGSRTRFICYFLLLCVLFRKMIAINDVKISVRNQVVDRM